MSAGQIYLIRHAQASAGAPDYDLLSPLGWEQSRLLGTWFGDCGIPVGRVVTGGMRRHRQTAEAFLDILPAVLRPAAAPERDAGFDEYDQADILARYRSGSHPRRIGEDEGERAVRRWIGGNHEAEYRESWRSFRARCLAALGRVDADGTILIFTSAGAIAALCQHLFGLPSRRAISLAAVLVNSGVTRLRQAEGRVTLQTFNSFAHLEKAGRLELITHR